MDLKSLPRQIRSLTRWGRQAELVSVWPGCRVHRREARAVHAALEQLSRTRLVRVRPDLSLEELVPRLAATLRAGTHTRYSGVLHSHQGLEALHPSPAVQELVTDALRERVAERVRRHLLGTAADRCTWDNQTLSVRSVRGIVNERVRWCGGCTCM